MIKCCIFDLDGTVLDTVGTIAHFVNLVFSKHNIPSITAKEAGYFAGDGARVLIKRSLASRGIEDEEIYNAVYSEYMYAYDNDPIGITKPFDGIEEMLSALKGMGIKLVLLSNKPDFVTQNVVEHFFPGIFDGVFGAKDSVKLKPCADYALSILDKMGIKPCESVFIGDTSVDIKTGINMGACRTVGVLWGFRDRAELAEAGADVIVGAPCEITEEIKKWVD